MSVRKTVPNLIRDQLARRAHLQALEQYVLDDQWQAGDGWTGPKPTDLSTGAPFDVLTLIERQFVSRNILNEIASRHRDGVLSREPQWKFTNVDGRKKLVAEAEEALTTWWDEGAVPAVLQEAVRTLMFSAERSDAKRGPQPARSPLRLHLRASSVDQAGRIPRRATLTEALADINVHAAAPYACGVLRNLDGDPIATHYTYVTDDSDTRVEITGVARTLRAHQYDVPPEYPDDLTVVIVTDQMGGTILDSAAYPLGKRQLVHELTREALITQAAITQQKLINKAYTMMSHNLDVAGFTERTILNAQMPGHWLDANGERADAENGVRFVPDPLYVGAGATNFLAGMASTDEAGLTRYASPSIVYRDPVPPGAFTETIAAAELAVLKEAKQLHVALAGDAVASGASRIQAANDFVGSLELTAVEVNRAVRWVIETALSLASVLMGQPGRYDDLRPVAEARLSAVQPGPEDVRVVIEKRAAGLVSLETAMSEAGVEDVDAELQKIEDEQPDEPPPVPSPAAFGLTLEEPIDTTLP